MMPSLACFNNFFALLLTCSVPSRIHCKGLVLLKSSPFDLMEFLVHFSVCVKEVQNPLSTLYTHSHTHIHTTTSITGNTLQSPLTRCQHPALAPAGRPGQAGGRGSQAAPPRSAPGAGQTLCASSVWTIGTHDRLYIEYSSGWERGT